MEYSVPGWRCHALQVMMDQKAVVRAQSNTNLAKVNPGKTEEAVVASKR